MQQTYGVPAILSLFFPGLGQLAKGQWQTTVLIWGAMLTPWILFEIAKPQLILSPRTELLIWGLVLLFASGVWLWGVVDAYRRPVQ